MFEYFSDCYRRAEASDCVSFGIMELPLARFKNHLHLLFSNCTGVIVGEISGNVLLLLSGLIIIETKQFIFSQNVPQLAAYKLVNLKNCDKRNFCNIATDLVATPERGI